ncbi:permease prefix domain 1-containing protein, partial [uncultured Enorma sp.]|uniref:permease prefix domain 1-containing protein n=1 Tax=uncultured Enorma sp. TaxID=1714346 RepID=UPI002803BD88
MNELRMYVEHLFEGRVLTAEMIELKEEIYGNLVARYEDYVAGGMGEAEALAQAKASITSIDDVLAGEGEDAFEGAASSASEDAEPTAVHASDDDAGESTCEEGAAAEGAAATVVQPAPATASTADASEHKSPWLKILAVAAAIIAVILVATVLWNVVLEPTGDQLEDTV